MEKTADQILKILEEKSRIIRKRIKTLETTLDKTAKPIGLTEEEFTKRTRIRAEIGGLWYALGVIESGFDAVTIQRLEASHE